MAEKPKTKYVESKVVRYSNPLNLTSYHLDLFQLRVVMSAIANVSNVDAIDPNKTYFVNATDIMALGTRKQEVYAALRKVSDSLFNGFATISRNCRRRSRVRTTASERIRQSRFSSVSTSSRQSRTRKGTVRSDSVSRRPLSPLFSA